MRRHSLRRNPSGLDTAASALNLALTAGIVYVGYRLTQEGPLKEMFDRIFGGGKRSDESTTSATIPCLQARPTSGNTQLSFDVQPSAPQRQLGVQVLYSGLLTIQGLLTGKLPATGMAIEFWDPDACTSFDYARTDDSGYFQISHPLAPDELDGYRVFCRFPGQGGLAGFGRLDPAVSGIWTVRPQ